MKSKLFILYLSLLLSASTSLLGVATAEAQSKAFYEGKTVRVIVGPSGGYDYWARLLARYMPKYIAGNPNFVVQAMPGAGSVIATNYVYNIAQPDGLTVGMPTQQIYMGEFVGNDEVKFQSGDFSGSALPTGTPRFSISGPTLHIRPLTT